MTEAESPSSDGSQLEAVHAQSNLRAPGGPPPVSIGMFVYNGEKYLRSTLDALLAQTFADFELIISDNASSDGTEAICREYAAADRRIAYIRHPSNIGPAANAKFVLEKARGEYFMWAACDDTHSLDFIEVNYEFLVQNPDYVASTCPTGFEGDDPIARKFVDFELDGEVFERFTTFFRYCWVSHGIFYSLVRTDTLRSCEIVGDVFLAIDWAINLFLASRGKIHRTQRGYTIFGVGGVSRGIGVYKTSRVSSVEFFWPFYRLGRYCATITTSFTLQQKLRLAVILLKLNLVANYSRLRAEIQQYSIRYAGPKVR